MDREDMQQRMLQFALDRALHNMQRHPRRSLRNLVDMGALLVSGKSGAFVRDVQALLRDEHSPYYGALDFLLETIEPAAFRDFCISLGYHALTRSGKAIAEEAGRLNVPLPWMLHLRVPAEEAEGARVEDILWGAVHAGMRAFCFCVKGKVPEYLWNLIRRQSDCAFIIWASPESLDGAPLSDAQIRARCFFTLDAEGPGFVEACAALRGGRMAYAAYGVYTDASAAQVPSEAFLHTLALARCPIAALIPAEDASVAARQTVGESVARFRRSPTHPVVLMDYLADLCDISEKVTGTAALLLAGPKEKAVWLSWDGRRTPADETLRALLQDRGDRSATKETMHRAQPASRPAP